MNGQSGPIGLESKIGLFWINRVGIAMLVLGFAFLMMFSVQNFAPMQFFGPHLKILSGALASAVLLFAGKKLGHMSERRWFAHGLAAGGWALLYFTTYAAYYIPEAKIVSSLPVETGLLLAVALCSLGWAVKAGSEILAILSIALTGVSILFSEPGLTADTSFVILAVLASILGNRQSWKKLFAFAVGVCYLGHAYCSQSLLGATATGSDYLLSAIFDSFIWLSFSIGLGYCIHPDQRQTRFVTIITYANAAFFTFSLMLFCKDMDRGALETILAAAGAVYMGMARWLMKREQKLLSTVHFLLGLSLINGAKAMRFSGVDLLALDVMQIWILMALGTRFDIRAFKLVAYFLALTFIPTWMSDSHRYRELTDFGMRAMPMQKIGLVSVLAFGHLSYYCRKLFGPGENKLDHCTVYFLLANIMFALTAHNIIDQNWVALVYFVQAGVDIALGIKLRHWIFFVTGVILMASGIGTTGLCMTEWTSPVVALQVAAIYGTAHYCRMLKNTMGHDQDYDARQTQIALYFVATVLLTALLNQRVDSTYLTLSLGIEGLILMAASAWLKENTLRYQAFIIIFLLIGKLLFVDLANRGTLERIVSFIGAGVTLILSSYVYALGTNAFTARAQTPVQEPQNPAQPQEPAQEPAQEPQKPAQEPQEPAQELAKEQLSA